MPRLASSIAWEFALMEHVLISIASRLLSNAYMLSLTMLQLDNVTPIKGIKKRNNFIVGLDLDNIFLT